MKRNWLEIIPELKDWGSDCNSPEVFPLTEGRLPLAIGYLTLCWPSFIEYDGMVFTEEDEDLSAERKKNITDWLDSTKGDKRAVEAVVNHRHILDHFGGVEKATEPQVKVIGEILKEMWACKLARDFPKKKFIVEFIEGTQQDLIQYQITFYQKR